MAAFLGPVLAGAMKWLAANLAGLAVWLGLTWFIVETDFGMEVIFHWLSTTGWDVRSLVLPEWREEWTEAVCAANAWVPIAEAWVIFKVYWAMLVGSITVRWTFKLMALGRK